MYAAAADLPHGLVLAHQARDAGFTGVGLSDVYAVHVDVRDGSFVTWKYTRR